MNKCAEGHAVNESEHVRRMESQLSTLLAEVAGTIGQQQTDNVKSLIYNGEYALALEWMWDALGAQRADLARVMMSRFEEVNLLVEADIRMNT